MVFINAVFTFFSLLWLISQLTDGELDPELWFALAFTLLCAANTINLLGSSRRRHGPVWGSGELPQRQGEPLAERPDVPAAYGVLDAGDGDGLVTWPDVIRRLEGATAYWICSARPDGRPHSVPVWGVWLDEIFYFGTHRQSRKARNLVDNPYITVHLDSSEQAVMVEGPARQIGDARLRALVDQAYVVKYDLAADAPGDDPNPIFALRPRFAFAWSGSDFATSATRWTFDS
jgi:hypothetical protein